MAIAANYWRTIEFAIGKKTLWFVYRLKNPDKPDDTGNRSYYGGNFETVEEAKKCAAWLNSCGFCN